MFAIKKMRERAGLNQQDVADALGIKKARYGDWERETTTINLRDAIRLADLFDCTLDELAGRRVSKQPSMSPNEQRIVDVYRATDTRGRENIDSAVDREARYMDESALKEKRDA